MVMSDFHDLVDAISVRDEGSWASYFINSGIQLYSRTGSGVKFILTWMLLWKSKKKNFGDFD